MVKIDGLDRVAVYVPNIEEAKRFWGDLFETEFTTLTVTQKKSGVVNACALSPIGFELVQRVSPPLDVCGMRGFHLKVKNLAEAVDEMKRRGFDTEAEIEVDELREAVFNVRGIRLILVEYEGENYGLKKRG